MSPKEQIASTVAGLLKPGEIVNLGIGIPTMVINYLVDKDDIFIHSENGILGVHSLAKPGEEDIDLVDAGKTSITVRTGAAFFDSSQSFAMIRGGDVDVAVIGALQVDEAGRMANWSVTGRKVYGVGGAMDLMEGAKKVIVAITHTTRDGSPKLVKQLQYPRTSFRTVDFIVTELAVFQVKNERIELLHPAPGITVKEIKQKTEADFSITGN